MPNIEAFLGSDIVGGILSTGLYKAKLPSVLIDVGTNTEIVVCNKGKLAACSCASGPAFEGGHIKNGMKAESGAIKTAQINSVTLDVSVQTIGNVEPVGLCGSGVIDLIAEMLKARILSQNGAIQSRQNSPRFRVNDQNIREFVIREGNDSHLSLVITQKDIRKIQLAKAAIRTGIEILLDEMHVSIDEVNQCLFAGAFGTYLNSENAKTIGMIPNFSSTTIRSVGNAACAGAKAALISTYARKASVRIARNVQYIELSRHSNFQSLFLEFTKF